MAKRSDIDALRRHLIVGGSALISLGSSRLSRGDPQGPPFERGKYDGSVTINGNAFANGAGAALRLRGTNIQDYAKCLVGSADASGGLDGGNDQPHGPNLGLLADWKMNTVRIGINEAWWLGYECYTTAVNGDGSTGWVNPPRYSTAESYQQQVSNEIAALNRIGCYVILTLAATNPGRSAPGGQDWMANQDNSIECWRSIATVFGYPNGAALKRNGGQIDDRSVLFELFNEPEMYGETRDSWSQLMDGAFINQTYTTNSYGAFPDAPARPIYPYPCTTPVGRFVPGEKAMVNGEAVGIILCYHKNATKDLPSSGSQFIHLFDIAGYQAFAPRLSLGDSITGSISKAATQVIGEYGWYVAGHAQMLAAIRAAGACNVCLLSGDQYAQDLSEWARYAPSDAGAPSGHAGVAWKPQIAASWHPYPAWSYVRAANVVDGGRGYAVGDTILLPMPENGRAANSVYWQAQLQVTAVSGSSVSLVKVKPYTGGRPGVAGGKASEFSAHSAGGAPIGGAYSNLMLPTAPVSQYSSSGSGSGASFELAFTSVGGTHWPNRDHWEAAAALRVTPGVPVVITETGEHYASGASGSPWMAALTAWCDANQIGLIVYAYTPSSRWTDLNGGDFGLVDGEHKPTPGYGSFMYKWFRGHGE